jgi:hypothetical protein
MAWFGMAATGCATRPYSATATSLENHPDIRGYVLVPMAIARCYLRFSMSGNATQGKAPSAPVS